MVGEAKAMKAWWTPVMTKGRRLHVRAANRKPTGFIAFNLATFNSAVLYIHTLGSRSVRTHTWTYTRSGAHTKSLSHRSFAEVMGQVHRANRVLCIYWSRIRRSKYRTAYEGQLWAAELYLLQGFYVIQISSLNFTLYLITYFTRLLMWEKNPEACQNELGYLICKFAVTALRPIDTIIISSTQPWTVCICAQQQISAPTV